MAKIKEANNMGNTLKRRLDFSKLKFSGKVISTKESLKDVEPFNFNKEMKVKKIMILEKTLRTLACILIVISLLLFIFFIYKYMNAGNLTPEEQINWKSNIVDPIGPHVEKRIHEAQNISLYAIMGTIFSTFFYGISKTLKSKI